MNLLHDLEKPTLLVNPQIARRNIAFMAQKARRHGLRFRPHFKTHQSAVVGEWFREQGVQAITVSSVDMARYFADYGWQDILIAFPVNLHQMRGINELAGRVRLGLLVESPESLRLLSVDLTVPVDLWIEIDTGSGRTGIPWDRPDRVAQMAANIRTSARFTLRGLLTHAGFTYSAESPEEVCQRYQLSVQRMVGLQAEIQAGGFGRLELSVGDTPGCTLSHDLGRVDEIRPGNFVFYDGQMLRLGVCEAQQVAAVLAAPLVALHPERSEAVVYGGAVHLSKDVVNEEGYSHYGYVVPLEPDGIWSAPIPGAYVARLSQEHGVIHFPQLELQRLSVGDWVGILPAHICLTVAALGSYRLLDGNKIPTLGPRG
jgi:D-serine deaminase-like pyridoxal phosphate-dependent protein